MTHILVVEDDIVFGTMITTWLQKKGFDADKATSVGAAVRIFMDSGDKAASKIDLVLSDLRLPDHDGLFLLEWMRKHDIDAPFIVMTNYAEVQNAVLAMKSGAADYIAKPVHPDILLQKINEALKAKNDKSTNAKSSTLSQSSAKVSTDDTKKKNNTTPSQSSPRYIEGKSEASRQLYSYVQLVAPTPMSVLILGASGTGKEYVAHRIHELSKRNGKPFVAIDCGAIAHDVAASELFGHKKGAFTGADADKRGAFEAANGGTLFLDEIGNLSYDIQVQMLRALQERRIRPVGSTTEIPIDIRLVCATNEDLELAISEKRFREDLYHRISEFTIRMPMLNERGTDIFLFANLFISHANEELSRCITGFDSAAAEMLVSHTWHGNLRELNNVIKRAVLMAQGDTITALDLSQAIGSQSSTPSLALQNPDDERRRILQALQQTNGNKAAAARLLGIDRKTLYNKIDKLQID